jgi:Fe-S-cluster containining protein
VTREAPFGYRCHGCGHCCRYVLVPLDKDEIDRLAQNRGVTPETITGDHTVVRGGVRVLRHHPASGDCTFRSEGGCVVYPDRPLACRLYPLKRDAGANGEERWRIPPPDPASRGEYMAEGTIGEFLERQGVGPFPEGAGATFVLVRTSNSASS